MKETKNIVASKTFWGALIQLLSAVSLSPAVDVSATASAFVMVIGFVLTVYGRIAAKKDITL